ncbi:hypothetical protein H0A36_18380 [Endozoicomonas sp. SM1973]|uniref:Uncharacterized protein n=1 Tax=Spartinivicinus marinus TaxID=2994442 RepID=A0A853IK09_9GAMM|nr:hypothetical protein [Spartinivicinus marinus]MCX4027254.1 hypothetical protein [Spartinivicinus marinus]NYZ67986.1 hypothetical protein [Spartinivicinus marinus]
MGGFFSFGAVFIALLAFLPFIVGLFLMGRTNKMTNYLAVLGIFYAVTSMQSIVHFLIPSNIQRMIYSNGYGVFLMLGIFYCIALGLSIVWFKKRRESKAA